jgi:hypothetical protein
MKVQSCVVLALVPTLILSVVRATDEVGEEPPSNRLLRRRTVEATEEDASGTTPSASEESGTAPESEETAPSSKRVWVQFKKETSHASALGLVRETIVSNLGASEADATNLLVPESTLSSNSTSISTGTSTSSYPFAMHYNFYESSIPFMVMSVDDNTMTSLEADPCRSTGPGNPGRLWEQGERTASALKQ